MEYSNSTLKRVVEIVTGTDFSDPKPIVFTLQNIDSVVFSIILLTRMVLGSRDCGISFLCSPGLRLTGFDKG